ncbi:MAG: diaminopropionate ammonia-lyase [Vicinamibacterales bacterium]
MSLVYVPSRSASAAAASLYRGMFTDADYARQRAFFSDSVRFPSTPLHELTHLAASLGLGRLWLKDETDRFGLPSFKGLGTMFALQTLQESGALRGVRALVCASEGNHGRAVAHAARRAGVKCRVYLGEQVAGARADAIRSEGAEVVRVAGTYDEAVRRAAADAAQHGWHVISDTSWPGYEEIPRQIMLGYTRMLDEAEQQWGADGPPDLMAVQGGVGGLVGAAASWLAWRYREGRPKLVVVEPARAACIQAAARAGRVVALDSPLTTIMGGLRCGEMSPVAFRVIDAVASAYMAIEDEWTRAAMRRLAQPAKSDPRLVVGPSGAAGVAALLAMRAASGTARLLETAHGRVPTVVVIATEGATEPALWEKVTGSPSEP